MDLNEMKAGWNVLNECLAQNEIVNRRVVKELITSKTKSAYEAVYHSELQGLYLILFIGLILLPGCMFLGVPFKWASFLLLEAVMVLALSYQFLMIYCLAQFKLNYKSVDELTRVILRYNKLYWYNKRYGAVLGIGAVVICFILEHTYISIFTIVFNCLIYVVAAVVTVTKMRQHDQSLKEVEQGLAELKAFESNSSEEIAI